MIFYKHFLKDYAADTGHLSMLEDGAYRRLLDVYYATEKPLPADERRLFRLLRAVDSDEQAAVRTVLSEFWNETPEGWTNSRGAVEIEGARQRAETNRRIAEERESKRKRHQEHNEPSTKRSTKRATKRYTNRTTESEPSQSQSPDKESVCVDSSDSSAAREPPEEPPPSHTHGSNGGEPKAGQAPTEGQLTYIRSLCRQRDIPVPDVATATDAAVLIDDLKAGKKLGPPAPPESDEELAARRAAQLRGLGNCKRCGQLHRARNERGLCASCAEWVAEDGNRAEPERACA